MAIESILELTTAILLGGAVLTSLFHIAMQLRKKRLGNDFTILLSIFVVGWLFTEMLSIVGSKDLRPQIDMAHFIVLLAFASILALRWRWTVREALGSLEKSV